MGPCKRIRFLNPVSTHKKTVLSMPRIKSIPERRRPNDSVIGFVKRFNAKNRTDAVDRATASLDRLFDKAITAADVRRDILVKLACAVRHEEAGDSSKIAAGVSPEFELRDLPAICTRIGFYHRKDRADRQNLTGAAHRQYFFCMKGSKTLYSLVAVARIIVRQRQLRSPSW